jgi:hypothetical protein
MIIFFLCGKFFPISAQRLEVKRGSDTAIGFFYNTFQDCFAVIA